MSKLLVSGLVNLETTCKTEDFPIKYSPIDYNFFGINTYPAGVALNISLALKKLGDDVKLLSILGNDLSSKMIEDVLATNGISLDYLMKEGNTASSVILYEDSGKRKIYCDLKYIQEKSFDENIFLKAVQDCDAVILCNINFSRKFLSIAKEYNKVVATDVHCLSDIDDEYNKEFIQNSDIVFLSNENIVGREKEFLESLKNKYAAKIFVCGMGEKGSLMYDRDIDDFVFTKSCTEFEVVNTVGAGDALFSSFVHFYIAGRSSKESIELATRFAARKISVDGAAKGFVSEEEL